MTLRYEKMIRQNLSPMQTSGDEFYTVCPFHDDHSPSFAINGKSGLWICHACGLAGNINQLVEALGINLPETSLRHLKERIRACGVEEPEEVRILPEAWLMQFDHGSDYWENRGLSEETVVYFRLGFDPLTNSATIPLRNTEGQLLGVIRRRLDDDRGPRYIYPKGFQAAQNLFGAFTLDLAIKVTGAKRLTKVALVEGSIDMMTCWDAGFYALGLYGAKISSEQVRIIHSLGITTVVMMLDNDPAGKVGTNRVAEKLRGINVLYGQYPDTNGGNDPGDMTNAQLLEMFHHPVSRYKLVQG